MAMAMASLCGTPAVASLGSSPLFADFSGLASSKFCPLKSATASPVRVFPSQHLRIEAKDVSRRETVKIRHARIRKKLSGTTERPRLAVFRSNQHIYAQVIDDTKSCTLASASTIQKQLREELQLSSGPTIDAAKRVGAAIAKACLEKGITKVAFDRGGFTYHGRIQALADAARENGLEF